MRFVPILAGLLAVASTSLAYIRRTRTTDKFDQGRPGTLVDSNEGRYIKYNAWSYALQLIPKAPSGNQVIGTGIHGQSLEGEPAFLPIDTNVVCFDLKSIRNACFVNTQVTGIVPVSCTLKFSATSLKTGAVNTEWAVFNAKSLTEPFATTTFPDSFKCAKRVDITLVSAAIPGDAVTVGAALDDVEYVAHVRT